MTPPVASLLLDSSWLSDHWLGAHGHSSTTELVLQLSGFLSSGGVLITLEQNRVLVSIFFFFFKSIK